MRIFQEEIFGPVVSVTTFHDEDEALEMANDTLYGLGRWVVDAGYESRVSLWARRSRRDVSGRTATTYIRRMRRLADISSRASGVRTIR